MGFSKDEKSKRLLRAVKTLFFLITMLISLLLFSAPVLLVIADTLLPSALLSASLSPSSLSLQTLSSHLQNYDFRYSLIDIPLISILRSAIIICVYSLCDGPRLSRGPYLGITTMCSLLSLMFVSLKASVVFAGKVGGGYVRATEIALFICSLALAVGHIVVAYRTSCRERRKLLVYKIDIEAVLSKKISFLEIEVETNGWLERSKILFQRFRNHFRDYSSGYDLGVCLSFVCLLSFGVVQSVFVYTKVNGSRK